MRASRNIRHLTIAAAAVALGACSDEATNAQPGVPGQEEPVALGLTLAQLSDADLISAEGTELGEVERVVRNKAGEVAGLIVEIEDSNPDRFVQLPLGNLVSVRTGNEADDLALQGDLTREQLAQMPPVEW